MIRVVFDNTEINGDYILGLNQSAQPYNQNFAIGNTVCRQFTLEVKNAGFNFVPTHVYLYEDNGSQTQSNWTKYATLLVDDKQLQDGDYTTFNLTDVMVRFNKDLTYTVTDTCWDILTDICWRAGISLATQTFYMDDFQITWEDNVTERDFISYVAEVNGGYAYIDADGNLNIAQYSSTPAGSVDMNKVAYFKIGERHYIDRVYVELASATKFYPASTNNDTLYLNPENILFNDAQGYTIDGIIQHIYSIVNGLEFYNIKIDNCITLPNVRACQIIQFGESGNWTPFLCTVNFSYNTAWRGGYETDLDCKLQEETQIVTSAELVKRINIKVDREAGEIRQEISDLDAQTTASLLLKVDKDGDEIISLINASADNIVLNAKSLIFGEYPNGNYIEEKNYYDGSNNIGVTFDGTGYVRFQPQNQFIVNNIDSNNNVLNEFVMSTVPTNNETNITYTNYNYSDQSASNTMLFRSTATLNTVTLSNNRKGYSSYANRLYMSATASSTALMLYNNFPDTATANTVVITGSSSGASISLSNYEQSGSGSTLANQLKLNSDKSIMFWSGNDMKIRSDGAVRIYANLNVNSSIGDYNNNPTSSQQDIYLGGYSVKLQAQTNGKIYLYWGSTRYYIGRTTISGTNVLTWTTG